MPPPSCWPASRGPGRRAGRGPRQGTGRARTDRGLGRTAVVPRSEAVLCHGVLMYQADPGPVLRAVAGLTAPGGLVSLLVRNGDALAMRPGLLGDWAACAQALTSSAPPPAIRTGSGSPPGPTASPTSAPAWRPGPGRHRLVRGAGVYRHRAGRRRAAAGPRGGAGPRGTGRAHRSLPPGGRPLHVIARRPA